MALRKAGFQIVHVPEDWLFKAYPDDDVLVDVLYQLNVGVGRRCALAAVPRCSMCSAIRMPVLTPTLVVSEKLRSLNEHHCDFAAPAARGPRGAREGRLGCRAGGDRRQ